jgi:ABC-type iron transport system FetAB ATPase subunit
MSDKTLSVRDLTFLDKGPYTFSVAKGECIGLSGRSGIGKTQLFRAITDLIPFKGEILLGGIPSSAMPAPEWRSRVSLVPADSSWWYDRVRDHFLVSEHGPFLYESFKLLGLEKEAMDWQVNRLSTGERQRLALVRALGNRPTVLLLDEPSSGLDTHHTSLLETFVEQYRQQNNVSVIWVSHDCEQLRRVASREYRMEESSLIEITPNPLQNHSG